MSDDLNALYQEVILDHARHPRSHCKMDDYTVHESGFNPLCGDKIDLFLRLENNTIADASFLGSGCAISMASASLLIEQLKGKSLKEATEIFEIFHGAITSQQEIKLPGKLIVLEGVKAYPSRIKCATLAWHTLQAALGKSQSSSGV